MTFHLESHNPPHPKEREPSKDQDFFFHPFKTHHYGSLNFFDNRHFLSKAGFFSLPGVILAEKWRQGCNGSFCSSFLLAPSGSPTLFLPKLRFMGHIVVLLYFCNYVWKHNDCLKMHVPIMWAGWQKLCEGMKGLHRKVWSWTKVLGPNIRYFVATLRFVANYALFGNL